MRGKKGEEGYFVSMTDMMVGLLFVFIILLMYFALQFQKTTKVLTGSDDTRTEILMDVQEALADQGVRVEIFPESGVLRLPDEILFERGEADPKPDGVAKLGKLATALSGIIPCYAEHPGGSRPPTCPKTEHHIELLFIEGHTDKDPLNSSVASRNRDNWDLSYERARNTRMIIENEASILGQLLSAPEGDPTSAPILAHVGYAHTRPVASGDDATSKAQNRRIDLRLIMVKPKPEEVGVVEKHIGSAP